MEEKIITKDGKVFSRNKVDKYKGLGRRDNIDGTIMATLPFIGYILFSLFPMVFSLFISFTELHSYDFANDLRMLWSEGIEHTFDNYINLFYSEYIGISLINTLEFTLIVPVKLALQLYVANLLTKKVPGAKFFRVCFFIPTIMSTVAVATMWRWILEPKFGILNTVFRALNLPSHRFIEDAAEFMPCVWLLSIWWGGCNVILMDSALAAVDVSLKEAARVDGATEMRVFWSVVFPCMTPTLFYHLVMNFIHAMQEMGLMQVIVPTNMATGPGNKALTLSYYMYRLAFGAQSQSKFGGLGFGCALGWFIAVLIVVITRLQFWLSKKWVSYD